jgi:hypothetical protein
MDSLITRDQQQLELPLTSSDQMDDALFFSDENVGRPGGREFTGARLFSKQPETYRAIVALSAEGLGAMRIGRILGVSPNTVLAVRDREGVNVDIEKKRIAGLSRAAARMCVERIVEMLSDPEQLKNISLRDRGIVFGILAEKSELLSGSPTARIAVDSSDVELSEYLKWLRAEHAKQTGLEEEEKKEKVIDAEVVERGQGDGQDGRQGTLGAGQDQHQGAGQDQHQGAGQDGLGAGQDQHQGAGQDQHQGAGQDGLGAGQAPAGLAPHHNLQQAYNEHVTKA